MDTSILTPKDLFQKDIRYTIPTFQRPYVWTQDDQWEPLWNDVRNVAEEYLEELERLDNDSVQAQEKTKPHFLGAVVLQQVPTAVQNIEQREVIDGQQRVTTLQLMLDAIQVICEERGLRPPATRLSKLVTNDKDLVGDESHHIFKLWPTRTDRDAFRHAMDNGLAINDFEESLIVQAHEFFQQQVRKWMTDDTGLELERINALETAVTALLQLVVIGLDSRDDPNVIFETLNARGTPLEQSDLIKNFVLAQSPNLTSGGEDVWKGLDDVWWRTEVRQGRLFRPRLDMLFNYWLAMHTSTEVPTPEVPPSRVFDVFRRCADGRDIDALMLDVRRDLANYRRFETGQRTPEEELFYYRTGVMQIGVFTPALLLLFSAEHNTRVSAFRALESFLVRRMICRMTTKDYNRLTIELSSRLLESELSEADKVVKSFLREQKAYSREWPSDETVASTLETSPLYRLLTRGRLRLVLEGIESQRRSTMAEQLDVPKNLTIEHLMPVSWGENWPLPGKIDDEMEKQNRNGLVHTIGNLTLVTQKLNSSLSNSAWESKRHALLAHSVMNMNSELMNKSAWDEKAILRRNGEMAKLIANHWPGPDSEEWD